MSVWSDQSLHHPERWLLCLLTDWLTTTASWLTVCGWFQPRARLLIHALDERPASFETSNNRNIWTSPTPSISSTVLYPTSHPSDPTQQCNLQPGVRRFSHGIPPSTSFYINHELTHSIIESEFHQRLTIRKLISLVIKNTKINRKIQLYFLLIPGALIDRLYWGLKWPRVGQSTWNTF